MRCGAEVFEQTKLTEAIQLPIALIKRRVTATDKGVGTPILPLGNHIQETQTRLRQPRLNIGNIKRQILRVQKVIGNIFGMAVIAGIAPQVGVGLAVGLKRLEKGGGCFRLIKLERA